MDDRIQSQTEEFEALNELIKSYKDLPHIVDDEYPLMRGRYERKLKGFLEACKKNGRSV